MKSGNILKKIGSGALWLSLGTVLTAVFLSFMGSTHDPQTEYTDMKHRGDTYVYAPEWDSPIRDIPVTSEPEAMPVYRGWEGDFHYKLEHRDGFYHGATQFLKMKGLRGETVEDIEVRGHIVFTPVKGNVLYAGEGAVNYSIARMSLSALGDGMIVHFSEGNGVDEIKRMVKGTNVEGSFLRMNRAAGNYTFRIEPGEYEADIDAFGVKVFSATEMKITKAFIEKMESEGRPVIYPEALKKMFPEYDWQPDRDWIALEVFRTPLPRSGNTLAGSYTDEKGGVLSWKFTAF